VNIVIINNNYIVITNIKLILCSENMHIFEAKNFGIIKIKTLKEYVITNKIK